MIMLKKVKYCVGLNGRPNNIETILEEFGNNIYEVYSPAPPDICPTGRRGHIPIDLAEIKRQAKLAHDYGVRYNVLMNGTCFGGLEFSESFRRRISDFVKYIVDIGADSTTIMNPFLIDLVRSISTKIEIIAGSHAEMVEPKKIERFKNRGATRVVLHQNVYRNFEMLKVIRQSTDLAVEIIPNQGCLYQCECFINHVNIVAHASTATEEEIVSFGDFDFPIKRCRKIRQTDPIEFLMSCFIRPEDVHIYEEMGFDMFKFAGRNTSTEWMVNALKAYISRNYEGNVFDLASHVGEHPKFTNLPNGLLNDWYQFMGSNADYLSFRKKAEEYSRDKNIATYFKK